jgi:diacylglycerol kinase
MKQPINIRKAIRSFRFAGAGVFSLFRYENNARIHLIAAVVVVLVGLLFDLSATEWIIIVIQIVLVWAAESFNTAIEKLADIVSPGFHPVIKDVKDLSAAAVLILTVCAIVAGGIIFVPKILQLI